MILHVYSKFGQWVKELIARFGLRLAHQGLSANVSLSFGIYLADSVVWLSRALCTLIQHTGKRRRKCIRLVTLPNIHRFKKIFIRGLSNKRFLIWLLTTPPHLTYAARLP